MGKKDSIDMFDVRVVERKIAAGIITKEEYEEWLSSLPESTEYVVIDEQNLISPAISDAEESDEKDEDPEVSSEDNE